MKHTKRFGSVIMLSSLISLEAFAASNISATDKSAWSENSGWLNFKDTNGGVTVYNDHLEGYVWAENIGWIRLGTHTAGGTHTYVNDSATNYGVNNNSGTLSDYAWSENVGWIKFNPTHGGGVSINATTGDFDGYAWAENVGWIHFKNASPAAYKVSYDVAITVDLSVSASTGTEADATVITVTATASAAVTGDQTVNLAVTGVDSSDYTLSGTTLTISDGQTTGTVTFTLVDDSANEGTETATLTISSPSAGIALGSTTSQTVSITDNDAPPTPPPAAPAPTPAPTTPSTSSSSSSSSSSSAVTTTGGPIVEFEGEGSGLITANELSSGEFSCHSSETCPTQIQIGWYRFDHKADEGSEFVEWRGQNCKKGEYTTTFAGTCIAVFKKLPEPPKDTATQSPETPTVPKVTEPTPTSQPVIDPTPTTPTPPVVTAPIPTTPTPPVVTEPVKPVQVNKVGFSAQAYQANENVGKVEITVKRQGTAGEVSVDLLSSDDSAKASIHYRPIDQTLFWASGDDTSIKVPVEIIDNAEVDGNKAVILSLGHVDNAEIQLETAVLNIEDDDKAQVVDALPEPIVPSVPVITEEATQAETVQIEKPNDLEPDERDEFALPLNTVVGSGPVNQCNTSDNLIGVCHAHTQNIRYQAIGEEDSLSNGILDHPLSSQGMVSNTTITEKGLLKGGQVSGYTQNEGLIEDVEFVGASITGKNAEGEVVGTIGGKITLASQVDGVIEDVRLAPDTQIVGSGKPKLGSHTNRDRLGGMIIGDSEKPAILTRVHIKTKSVVSNVILTENVTFGEGITFSDVEFGTEIVQKVTLSGQITGTRFQNTYTKLENVSIRANSHLSNVVIGKLVKFEEGVTLDDSVTFEVHTAHKATHSITVLPKLKGLSALDKQGKRVSTWARLEGGARSRTSDSSTERFDKKLTLKTGQQLEIMGNVLTDVRHIGKRADILVVAAHTAPGATSPSFYMLDKSGTPKPWDGTISSLVPFQSRTALAPVVSVAIWNKPLDIVGGVQVYFGYRLNDGLIVYSQEEMIEITLTE